MDDKANAIQRCMDAKLESLVENGDSNYVYLREMDFATWVSILEVGTFNPIERLAIKAALYKHKREATKKIICSTLVDGGYISPDGSRRGGDINKYSLLSKEDLCK